MEVDAAGIWDEGHASYPGMSADLPCANEVVRLRDESAEVSRRRSSPANQQDEGLNLSDSVRPDLYVF